MIQPWKLSPRQLSDIALWERLEAEADLPLGVGFSMTGPAPCCMCGDLTELVDLHYEAPFCNSGICNWAMNEDLRFGTSTL